MITVIRKVDTNWIEGRKGDKIGILPLAFVEVKLMLAIVYFCFLCVSVLLLLLTVVYIDV